MMKKFGLTLVPVLFMFLINRMDAQTLTLTEGSYDVSSGVFYDSGGLNNPYNSLLSDTVQMTLNSITTDQSGNLNPLQFNFSEFSCGVGDTLFIFDGNSVNAPLVGAYSLLQSPGLVNTSGSSITFLFISDGIEDPYGLNNGWVAHFCPLSTNPTTILLSAGTIAQTPAIVTCNAVLYDSGGPNGNYSLNENNTLVITSALNTHIVAFTQFFDLHSSCTLEIFDGNLNTNSNARRIGYFKNGFEPPTQIISSTNSLTFKFSSTFSGTVAPGFQFNIGCIPEIFEQTPGASGFPGTTMGMYQVGTTTSESEEIVMNCDEPILLIETNINMPGVTTFDYTVTSIPFVPPFPWYGTGLIQVPASQDDYWLGPQPLTPSGSLDTFSFSFYGLDYQFCVPNTNGGISFNPIQFGAAGWMFNQTIPNILDTNFNFISGNNYKNSIFGVLQDTYPGPFSPNPNSGIYYGYQGTYPNRTFVFSFYRLPLYSCVSDNLSTYQMVLYEGTNIIDVYIQDRTVCNIWNNGSGLVGILNGGGNQAVTPPNRNTGNWVASQEAWRFTPITPLNYEIQWYENVVSNENKIVTPSLSSNKIAVKPTHTTQYISLVTSVRQDGSTYSFMDTIKVIVNTPVAEGIISGEYLVSLNQTYTYTVPNIYDYDTLIWNIDNPNWALSGFNGNEVNLTIYSIGSGILSVYGLNTCGVSDTLSLEISTSLNIPENKCDQITVSPNPTSGTIMFSTPSGIIVDKIDVIDNSGKVILSKNAQNSNEIDISMFPSGNYFVKFSYLNKEISTNKIIKK